MWLVVAVDIARRLPETRRFERPHVIAPRLDRRRFAVLAAVALLANLFVAPASLFQNGYLEDVRGFSATTIAIFTIATATPAGHRADPRRAHRRRPRPQAADRRRAAGGDRAVVAVLQPSAGR